MAKPGGIGTKPFTIQCTSCLVTTDESNSQELLQDEWNHRIPTERPAPCQFYCEQQAFKIKIRNLKSLLAEAHQRFKQYDMDIDDSSLAPESHIKFMNKLEAALSSK